jgi:2-dehydro-3-deoxygalactonokinase
LPILASGMIGSAQGWCEAPYLPVPVDLGELSKHLTQLTTSRGRLVYIVPGLVRHGDIVSVMRGEETEILGALDVIGRSPHANLLIGLPGTHSKWARVSTSLVEHFETFMTGEVYAALCEHTILAQTMKPASSFFADAFERGVLVAMSPAGDLGLLSNIFSVRTLALTNKLTAEEQPDYLSGLLIGHEINALSRLHGRVRSSPKNLPPVLLIGDASLCARYERALELNHFESVRTVTDAAARGLWQIALQANLISAIQPSSTVSPQRSR